MKSGIKKKRTVIKWMKQCLIFVALSGTVCLAFIYYHHSFYYISTKFQNIVDEKEVDEKFCPGILDAMMSGTWKARTMTSREKKEMHDFSIQHLSQSIYKRSDLKCGNLSHHGTTRLEWLRVLCNPDGQTPCCFKNRCVNKTIEECRGPANYDLRPRIHAEYATWVPEDKRCALKFYNSEAACRLLNGSTILVAGDSLMRNLYTALLMVIRGDYKDGAFKPNISPKLREKCQGKNVFPYSYCREVIDVDPRVCNGSLNLAFKFYPSSKDVSSITLNAVKLMGKRKSMIFFGIGLWDGYNYLSITRNYLSPLLWALNRYVAFTQRLDNHHKKHGAHSQQPGSGGSFPQRHASPGIFPQGSGHTIPRSRDTQRWPKIIWSSTHTLGIWRYSMKDFSTDDEHGREYNKKMAAFFSEFDIPVFNTFNMTEGIVSIDGTHFGLGLNVVKAQMFLNYIQELQDKKQW